MRILRRARPFYLALAALLFTVGFTAPAAAQSPDVPMQTASDPGGRFTIDFPVGWEVQTSADGKPAMIGAGPGSFTEGRPNVNVVVETLSSPLSSEGLAQEAEPALRMIFHEFTIVQEGPTQMAGLPAYYRYYTWRTNSGVSLYQVQVYLAVARRGFVITGTTRNDPNHIRNEMPIVTRIINSFRPSVL